MKELICDCGNLVEVNNDVEDVKCWYCCQCMVDPPEKKEYVPTGRPRGWKLFSEFVDNDRNVFEFGVENPERKGTLPPTKVKKRKPKKKINAKNGNDETIRQKIDREEKEMIEMAKLYKEKMRIKNGNK